MSEEMITFYMKEFLEFLEIIEATKSEHPRCSDPYYIHYKYELRDDKVISRIYNSRDADIAYPMPYEEEERVLLEVKK